MDGRTRVTTLMKNKFLERVGERYQVLEIGRLFCIKKFEIKRENFIFNTFADFKPVKYLRMGVI